MKRKIMGLLCSLVAVLGLFLTACRMQQLPESTPGPESTGSAPTQAFTQPPTQPSEPDPVICYENVPYGAHPRQVMDIYIPEGSRDARYPVVLTVHGGEWAGGDKADMKRYTQTVLAGGCIHVRINFRLLGKGIEAGEEAPYEKMLDDIQAAFAFLAQNADRYQIDPGKAGIAGYSSGGHLALLYAYTRQDSPIPIRFVLSEAGPANFMDPKTFAPDGSTWLHEGHDGHEDIEIYPTMTQYARYRSIADITGVEYGLPGWEDAWKKASPAWVIPEDAPTTYLIYGTHDALIPISHGEFLQSRLPQCTLYEVLDGTHNLYTDREAEENFRIWLGVILEEMKRGG